jgi:hypothetical protein
LHALDVESSSSVYLHAEVSPVYVEGTIIDLEVVGQIEAYLGGWRQYAKLRPVLFGTLQGASLRIYYVTCEDHISALVQTICEKLPRLKRPLYAFNCAYEQAILYYNVTRTIINFQDLQPTPYMALNTLCTRWDLPRFGDQLSGAECQREWWLGHFENCLYHNRACLLKAAHVLQYRRLE